MKSQYDGDFSAHPLCGPYVAELKNTFYEVYDGVILLLVAFLCHRFYDFYADSLNVPLVLSEVKQNFVHACFG